MTTYECETASRSSRSRSSKSRASIFSCCFRPEVIDETTSQSPSDTWVETNTWVQSDGKAQVINPTTPKVYQDQRSPRARRMPQTALSLIRSKGIYTDKEWYAMLSYISEWGNEGLHPDGFDDARSEFSEMSFDLNTPRSSKVPRSITLKNAYAPKEPLAYAEPHWQYKPVDIRHFVGYWAKRHDISTPAPFPIDVTLGFPLLTRKVHESIPGLLLRESSDSKQLEMVATPSFLPRIPGLPMDAYCEYFNVDGTDSHWNMRRDLRLGRHIAQLYMTTDDILIMRVYAVGMFSNKVEWIAEDYMRLEDDGKTIVVRLTCRSPLNGKWDHFYIIGCYQGPTDHGF